MKPNIKIPPISKFKMYKPETAIELEPGIIQKIFGQKRAIKIDDTGLVVIHIKNERYAYQLYDQQFINLKNSKVIARFDIENLNEISIYDYVYDKFICTVKKILVWTKENPEVYYRHIGKVKKIVGLMEQSKKQDELKLSTKPIATEGLHGFLTNKLIPR